MPYKPIVVDSSGNLVREETKEGTQLIRSRYNASTCVNGPSTQHDADVTSSRQRMCREA